MCIGKNTGQGILIFEYLCSTNNKEEEILGVTIDKKLNFNHHIKRSLEKLVRKSFLSPEYLDTLTMIKEDSCLIVWSDRNLANVL